MERTKQAPVADRFIERWSPRSFDSKFEISDRKLKAIFEAARWTPSCFNIQPWRFIYTKSQDEENFSKFSNLLLPMNKTWAEKASALGFIICRKVNDDGEQNFYSQFDTGAAWMSMTMQAREFDLYTHGMGGIKKDEVYDYFKIDKSEYTVICGFALGKRADKKELPEKLQKREEKNERKDLKDIMFENHFPRE